MCSKSFWVNKLLRLAATAVCLALCLGCAPAASPEDGLSYTDALGRAISLPRQPKRVAALLGSFADVWCLAGGTLCAAAEDAWEDFGLSLPEAVNLGGAHSPSLETLIAARPELVLASASTASHVAMEEALESTGICVVYFDVDNFDDYLHMLKVCTDLTGRPELYQQNGLAIQRQIEKSKAQLSGGQLPEAQRRVLILRAATGFVKAKGSRGTILGEMLRDLGCFNIADSETGLLENLSVESVIRQAPYHIFVVTMGSDPAAAMANLQRMMDENPAWGTLEAVREGRLHVMEKELYNLKPNARWAEAYEKLTEILLGKTG